MVLEAKPLLLGRSPNTWPRATWPRADWDNSTVLSGELTDDVRRLVADSDGMILVVGSGSIARHLVAHDLVDEIRLMVFPDGSLDRGQALRRPRTSGRVRRHLDPRVRLHRHGDLRPATPAGGPT
ncbi:MAG: dihydrofolate reductase family protein [Candidatus Dormibacteria bacterium]